MTRTRRNSKPKAGVYLVPVTLQEVLTIASAADFLSAMRPVADAVGAPAMLECEQTLRDVADRYARKAGFTFEDLREQVAACR